MTLQLKILHFETSRTMFIVVVIVMLGSKSLDRIPILKNVDMSHVHILINSCTFVCLFVCLLVYRPTREFYTHKETSPLPAKGCTF